MMFDSNSTGVELGADSLMKIIQPAGFPAHLLLT
jgi:hypothetical protein